MSNLIQDLQWRYATKKMDPSKVVPADKLARILEAVRLSASSSGLQPYELMVVTDPQVREKIKAISWNQAQVTDGSHLLVSQRIHAASRNSSKGTCQLDWPVSTASILRRSRAIVSRRFGQRPKSRIRSGSISSTRSQIERVERKGFWEAGRSPRRDSEMTGP